MDTYSRNLEIKLCLDLTYILFIHKYFQTQRGYLV